MQKSEEGGLAASHRGWEVSSHVRKENTAEHEKGAPFSPYDCVSSKSRALFLSLQAGMDSVFSDGNLCSLARSLVPEKMVSKHLWNEWIHE